MLIMLGSSGAETSKVAVSEVGKSAFKHAIKKVPGTALRRVNRLVKPLVGKGRFFTKFGEKGVVNLGKLVPLAGGFVGGTIDAGATYLIGRSANRLLRSGPTLYS